MQIKKKKREAFTYATKYLTDQGRSTKIPIASVSEGNEPDDFWAAMAGKAVGGRAFSKLG